MYRKFLLIISVFLVALVISHPVEALQEPSDLQVAIPVRFITVQGEFFERIGVDFNFPTVTDLFRTNLGFGAAIGAGILFPEAIGRADVSVAAKVFGSRFSADEIRTQNGSVFPTEGDITDVGFGIDLALILGLADRGQLLQAPPISMPALRITAGGGVVRREVDFSINGIPFINDGKTLLYGEVGAGLQFPLNNIGRPGQTALFIGVNHRVIGGMDLHTIPIIPFHFNSTSTTSAHMELIILIKPRLVPVNER